MDNLEQRMGIADTVCVCCKGVKESVYLFLQCTMTGDLDIPEHAPLRKAITLEDQILHNKELKVNLVSVIGNMELMILEHIRSTKGDGKNHLQVQLKSTLMRQRQ